MTKNDTVLFNSHLTLSGYDNARSLTIIQSDDTVLEFTLRDKNLEPITLTEKVGQAQIIDSKRNALVATFDVQVDGSEATFSIDKILPVADYELYIKIGNQYFPSKEQSFLLRVIKAYDVVDDIDLNSRTTIDIVVDALKDDVISTLKEQVEAQVDAIIKADPAKFKGEKGDKFTRDDFTQEDWLSLRGEDAVPLKPSQLSGSELELIRGHSAYQVAVNEGFAGTEAEWLATLKGEKGDKPTRKDFTEEEWASLKGEDGNSLTFEQLSPEQQEALRGYSAYQIAVNKGFEGDVEQWLESLKGEKGDKFTRDDFTGEEWLSLKGEKGDKGDTGDSAYEEALKNGFVGSEVEWLESLKGKNGDKGDKFTRDDFTEEDWLSLKGEDAIPLRPSQLNDSELELIRGYSAYQVALNEGFEGTEKEWLESLKGEKGDKGDSAYEEALKNGFEGTEAEWLESLKGDKGDKGDSFEYEDFTKEQLDELRGETGQAFTFEMFTPAQLNDLRLAIINTELTENGDTLVTFSDGTTIIVQRGQKGESGINGLHGNTTSIENNEDGSYDIIVTNPNSETEIYRATIRDGVDGADGADGESLRYEDLTPEQIAELQEGLPVRPPKIYTREEYEALESYDPHTIYIVREA